MITQNFINILRDIMQRAGTRYGAYPLVDGPNRIYYTTQIAQDEQDSQYIGNNYRVQIGDGNTPATRNDYKLENQLLTGFTQTIVYSHAIDNDGDHVLIMDVTITNTGSDTLTICEIGYTIPTRFANTQGGTPVADTRLIVLVDRTVLDAPVTIEPNETKTIRYTLKTVENIVSEHANLQSKTATQNGTVTPDQGYDGLSSVVVNVSGGGGGGDWRDTFSVNWDFSNPVNTRGQSSYSGSGLIYTLDGWQLQGGKLSFVTGGIKLERYASGTAGFFMQRYKITPTSAMAGRSFTLSAIIDGTLNYVSGTIPSGSGGSHGLLVSGVSVRIYNYGTEFAVTIDIAADTGSHVIQAIKLEAGSTQTLATQVNGVWVLNNDMDADTEYVKARNGTVYNS